MLQSISRAGEEKIKERYRQEWTKAINEDDIIGMVKLIITWHTGKASEFTDKFIAVEDYRNFTYKEGTIIEEYANQQYLLDKKILQVGATHLPVRYQVYMVIMKLKEHKNLAITLGNWLSENYRNLSEFWRQTAAQLFYDRFRGVFGANSSFAAVSEVFWELIAPNLMLFR